MTEDIYRRRRIDDYSTLLNSLHEKQKALIEIVLDTLPHYRPHAGTNNLVLQFCNGVPGIPISIRLDKKEIHVKHEKCFYDAILLEENFRVYSLLHGDTEQRFRLVRSYEKPLPPLLTYSPSHK